MPLTLVYDGGCLFCRSFALRSELLGGLPDLKILDGRADDALRRTLEARGMRLADGAVLMEGEQAWHGSAAIAELSRRMQPSDPLMMVLRDLFRDRSRAEALYPGLLLARRLALGLRGLPVDPDQQPHG
jgi:predicted DCC family thiol-disulfide oxidoreductase YuxK